MIRGEIIVAIFSTERKGSLVLATRLGSARGEEEEEKILSANLVLCCSAPFWVRCAETWTNGGSPKPPLHLLNSEDFFSGPRSPIKKKKGGGAETSLFFLAGEEEQKLGQDFLGPCLSLSTESLSFPPFRSQFKHSPPPPFFFPPLFLFQSSGTAIGREGECAQVLKKD